MNQTTKKKFVMNFDEQLSQSEVINKKFIQLLKQQDFHDKNENYFCMQLDEQQKQFYLDRFLKMSPTGHMDYNQFRHCLGLLGRQDSFISRIFHLIDDDCDGSIDREEFLNYLTIIYKGSELQKAKLGWLLLSEGKQQLGIQEFMQIFEEISVVWNALTAQILVPNPKYIAQLFNILDVNQDKLITFSDYKFYFDQHVLMFGWFQYLNNIGTEEPANQIKKIKDRLQSKRKIVKECSQDNQREINQAINMKFGLIQQQISIVIQKMKEIAQKGNRKLKQNHHLNEDQLQIQNLTVSNTKSFINQQLMPKKSYKNQFQRSENEYVRNAQIKKDPILDEKRNHSIFILRELKLLMQSTDNLIKNCQDYKQLKRKQNQLSPVAIKHMQIKLNIIQKQMKKTKFQKEGELFVPSQKKALVYFGHQNWNIILNIMVGLRKSLKSLYGLASYHKLKEDNFVEQHQFLLGNKILGSDYTETYKFIQIAPLVFERLRIFFGVSNNDYQRSVGPQTLLGQIFTGNLCTMNQKCSTGKSGSFFYLTIDDKIFLKTIPKRQFMSFKSMVSNYYEHMSSNTNSLIVRIYGLYKLKIYLRNKKLKTIYFISMDNIFSPLSKDSDLKVAQTYDLKGSLYGRNGEEGKQLKDNDWIKKGKKIVLTQQNGKVFKNQIYYDSKFLKKNNINDYSLMVIFIDENQHINCQYNHQSSIFRSYKGGIKSMQNNKMYILSIIDILTAFETLKNIQYIFKTTFQSKDVSCLPPAQYCYRFRQFMNQAVSHFS